MYAGPRPADGTQWIMHWHFACSFAICKRLDACAASIVAPIAAVRSVHRLSTVRTPVNDASDETLVGTNGASKREDASAQPSAAALFASLWDALADLLGTSASAILLRRAARRATGRCPELAEVVVVREGLEYRYALPTAWNEGVGGPHLALQHLVGELLPLLANLTGPVAIRHLAQIRDLREHGIIPRQEES